MDVFASSMLVAMVIMSTDQRWSSASRPRWPVTLQGIAAAGGEIQMGRDACHVSLMSVFLEQIELEWRRSFLEHRCKFHGGSSLLFFVVDLASKVVFLQGRAGAAAVTR